MTELHKVWNRICQSLGVEQTTEFGLRIAAAHHYRLNLARRGNAASSDGARSAASRTCLGLDFSLR